MDADDLYFLWHSAAVDAGGRYCKISFYFDSRHPLPVKLMYWGNVLFPALTLLWAIAGAVLHRKIGFSRYLCGLLAGAVLTAIPIFPSQNWKKPTSLDLTLQL